MYAFQKLALVEFFLHAFEIHSAIKVIGRLERGVAHQPLGGLSHQIRVLAKTCVGVPQYSGVDIAGRAVRIRTLQPGVIADLGDNPVHLDVGERHPYFLRAGKR